MVVYAKNTVAWLQRHILRPRINILNYRAAVLVERMESQTGSCPIVAKDKHEIQNKGDRQEPHPPRRTFQLSWFLHCGLYCTGSLVRSRGLYREAVAAMPRASVRWQHQRSLPRVRQYQTVSLCTSGNRK